MVPVTAPPKFSHYFLCKMPCCTYAGPSYTLPPPTCGVPDASTPLPKSWMEPGPSITNNLLSQAVDRGPLKPVLRIVMNHGTIAPYNAAIFVWQAADPKYVAFSHPNLQIDNGYFWRTTEGKMECGLLDWCGGTRLPFVASWMGSVSGMEPDVLLAHDEGLMRCFADEYAKCGGPTLDASDLLTRFRLAYLGLMLGILGFVASGDVYKQGLSKEDYATLSGRKDERLMGVWELRCNVTMIVKCLGYWAKRDIHGEVLSWAREHKLDQGLYSWPPTPGIWRRGQPYRPWLYEEKGALPSFLESSFTSKREYEKWIEEQGDRYGPGSVK